MSWNDYVTSKLINTVDANQHKLENVLEHGALIGCNDGVTWAASAGFAVGKNKGAVEGSGEVEIDEFGKHRRRPQQQRRLQKSRRNQTQQRKILHG